MKRKKNTAQESEPDAKPAITTTHETRPLRCVLTDAERIAAGRKLAEKCAELQRTEEERKSVASEYKARLDRMTAERNELADKVTSGEEVRRVACELVLDYDKLTAQCIREDTGEIIEERPLSEAEKQMQLPFDEATPAPESDSPAKWRLDLIAQYGKKAVTKAEDKLLESDALYRDLDSRADDGDAEAGMEAVKMLAAALRAGNTPAENAMAE